MAKLYTLLRNCDHYKYFKTSTEQSAGMPVTLFASASRVGNLSVAERVIEYRSSERGLIDKHCGEVREPSPPKQERNNTLSVEQIRLVLHQVTELCNELDELIALHYCFFEAVESVHGLRGDDIADARKQCDDACKARLSVFPSWLRERDITVLDNLHRLQQFVRSLCQNGETS